MQDRIELDTITDITLLKSYKADEWDKVAAAQEQLQRSQQNIMAINARIAAVQGVEGEKATAESEMPVEQASV
jgi:hypothetical protein